MPSVRYSLVFDPSPEQVKPIEAGLHAFNLQHLGEDVIYDYHPLAVIARDSADQIVGGVRGELCWDWLYIRTMWVAERHRGRGIGTHLLAAAENAALDLGFSQAHLETTDFQALAFYLSNGYQIFGELPDKPVGHTWYYLKKDLSASPVEMSHNEATTQTDRAN
jgi:GNAT superfamily N-acetyltransferase